MVFKLPKHLVRWIIFSVCIFLVGFIIARLTLPSIQSSTPPRKSLMGGSKAQASAEKILEEQDASIFPIVAAGAILVLLLIYGYFREKRKRQQ